MEANETLANEILSAFMDGETVDPDELAHALAAPGAREQLIDFVRLRAALADGDGPAEAFVARMRRRLGGAAERRLPLVLRVAAALAIASLATIGAIDLLSGGRVRRISEEPPVATRVIRFEPGVDWTPLQEGER